MTQFIHSLHFWNLILDFWLYFAFNAGHHVGHYLPPLFLHKHHSWRVHLRILYQQIRWFNARYPMSGRFQKP